MRTMVTTTKLNKGCQLLNLESLSRRDRVSLLKPIFRGWVQGHQLRDQEHLLGDQHRSCQFRDSLSLLRQCNHLRLRINLLPE